MAWSVSLAMVGATVPNGCRRTTRFGRYKMLLPGPGDVRWEAPTTLCQAAGRHPAWRMHPLWEGGTSVPEITSGLDSPSTRPTARAPSAMAGSASKKRHTFSVVYPAQPTAPVNTVMPGTTTSRTALNGASGTESVDCGAASRPCKPRPARPVSGVAMHFKQICSTARNAATRGERPCFHWPHGHRLPRTKRLQLARHPRSAALRHQGAAIQKCGSRMSFLRSSAI
mmetsp:Transcript_70034/g.163882  ORF Transcript_70034/g.163882 Transcript_70034/m.163882 type:complete len:226 (+) Transcript_70034:687-1364(+)